MFCLARLTMAAALSLLVAMPILSDDKEGQKNDGDKPAAKQKAAKDGEEKKEGAKDADKKPEAKKPEKKPADAESAKKGGGQGAIAFPKGIEPNEDQKKALADLQAKYGPALAEIQKEMSGLISKDQRQARQELIKKLQAEGKKGKELQAALAAELKLSPEQIEATEKLQQKRDALLSEIKTAITNLLTEEQKAKLAPMKAKKPDAKKPNAEKLEAKKPAADANEKKPSEKKESEKKESDKEAEK